MKGSGALLLIGLSAWAAFATPALGQTTHVFRDGVSPSPAYAGTNDVLLSETPSNSNVSDPNTNYGTVINEVGGFPVRKVTLLRFDVSTLPPGARVESVSLTLDVTNGSGASYDIRELLVPWNFRSVTWMERLPGVRWSTPGALGPGTDTGREVLGTVTGGEGQRTFEFNALGLAAVQRWVANPGTNNGLWVGGFENDDGMVFHSTSAEIASEHPLLTVRYDGGSVARFQEDVSPNAGYENADDAVIARGPTAGGNYDSLGIRVSGAQGSRATSLVRFDVSSIPAGTSIATAALELSVFAPNGALLELFEVRRPWTENGASWSSSNGNARWSGSGALGNSDRGGAPLGSVVAGNTGSVRILLNAEGVARVQQWVNEASTNNGFLLVASGGSGALGAKDSEDPEASLRPALYVETAAPATGAPPSGNPEPSAPGSPDPLRDEGPDDDGDDDAAAALVDTRIICGCQGGMGFLPLASLLVALLGPACRPAARRRRKC